MKSRRIETGEIRILDRMRQHHRAERRRIAVDRLVAAALQPREQVDIGRPAPARSVRSRAGPCRRSAAAAVLASRAEIPIRIAPVTSFSSAQRPVSSEFVEPARELLWEFGLAERAQRGDDVGEGGRRRVVVAGQRDLGHISATVSERSPT